MTKYLYPILLLISSYTYSQNSVSFTDNFSGIESVVFNPANIVDSYYKIDVNIISSTTTLGNTYSVVKPYNIINDIEFGINDFNTLNNITNSNGNLGALKDASGLKSVDSYVLRNDYSSHSNFYGNSTVLGPSFLWSINKYNAVGFTTAIRFNGNVSNLNTDLYNQFLEKTYLDTPELLLKNDFGTLTGSGQSFSWYEVGFSYAAVPLHNSSELLKVGVSLKFLRGIKSYSFLLNNLTSNFTLNIDDPKNSSLDLNGSISVASSYEGANYGQGIDIGFVYEKRNKTLPINSRDKKGNIYFNKAPYSYKVSASVTDLGFLFFNNVKQQTNNVNVNLQNSNFNISNYLGVGFQDTKKQTYLLPTTAHLNVDFNINNHWFINTNIDYYLFSDTRKYAMKTVSNFSITPRYESQHISAFLPVSINKFGILKSGVGLRTGFLFVGSSSIISNFFDESKEFDFFVGVKIPIYNSKVIKEYKRSIRKYTLDNGRGNLNKKRRH